MNNKEVYLRQLSEEKKIHIIVLTTGIQERK